MEYISVNNNDSELYKKKNNNKIILYNKRYFNININRINHFQKSFVIKILVIFVILVIEYIIPILIEGINDSEIN